MNSTLLTTSGWHNLAIFTKVKNEVEQASRIGNSAAVTSGELRMAVATGNVSKTKAFLLKGMGISAEVSEVESGMMIEVKSPHSLTTIIHALRSSFDVLAAAGANGRMAVRVHSKQAPQIQ